MAFLVFGFVYLSSPSATASSEQESPPVRVKMRFTVPVQTFIPEAKCLIDMGSQLTVQKEISDTLVRVSYTRDGLERLREKINKVNPIHVPSAFCHTGKEFNISKQELNNGQERYLSILEAKKGLERREFSRDHVEKLFLPNKLVKRTVTIDGENFGINQRLTLVSPLDAFVLNEVPQENEDNDLFVRGSKCIVTPPRGDIVTAGYTEDLRYALVTYEHPAADLVLGCPEKALLSVPTETLLESARATPKISRNLSGRNSYTFRSSGY